MSKRKALLADLDRCHGQADAPICQTCARRVQMAHDAGSYWYSYAPTLPEPDGEIQLASDATVVVAEWPGTWIRVQCIDGKYPDWRRVIPNPDHCKASCAGSCAEWAKVIHAASSVAEDKYRACRLEWDKGQVQVTSSGLRGEYAGQLPTSELTGDGIQGVALDYLNGALGSLSGDRVLLQLINESFLLTQPDFDGVRVIMGMRT